MDWLLSYCLSAFCALLCNAEAGTLQIAFLFFLADSMLRSSKVGGRRRLKGWKRKKEFAYSSCFFPVKLFVCFLFLCISP